MNNNQKLLQEINRYNNYIKQLDNISSKLRQNKGQIDNQFSGVSRNAMIDDLNKLLSKSRNSADCSNELEKRLKRLVDDVKNQERNVQNNGK